MKIFILSKTDKKSEMLLSRYAFKIMPKVFIAFGMTTRIEDYIVSQCESMSRDTSMIIVKKGKENQAVIRAVGKVDMIREIDGIILFE